MVIISKVDFKFRIRSKVLKSLRFRIALLIILAWTIPASILFWVLLGNFEAQAVSLKTADIQNQCTILCDHLDTYRYLSDPASSVINSELTQVSNIYKGRVMVVDQDLRIIKDTYDLDEGKTFVAEGIVRCYQGSPASYYDKENRYIEVTSPIYEAGSDKISGVLLVSVSADTIVNTVEAMKTQGSVFLGIATLIIFVFAVWFAGRTVRPFKKFTRAADEVAEGYGESAFQEHAYAETEAMSEAFNKMMKRLKLLDDSRQEFVSNVSHELKTPLASMKVLADSLLAQEEVPNELYREFMQDITLEIERENDIITDLLSLVKLDRTSPDMNIQEVNINELLELILKRLKPIAAEKDVELVLESFRPVTAEVDEVKLTLALTNLVENAVKYNRPEGWVHVSLNADHKYFYVRVADSGIGIPEEDQKNIFERFYRVDKSHSREMGGTGLGLSISRNAVLMHRGSIKVYSSEGEGTTFTVRIPLLYVV